MASVHSELLTDSQAERKFVVLIYKIKAQRTLGVNNAYRIYDCI